MHIFSAVMSPFSNDKQTDNSLANVLHWNITYSVCVCVYVCTHMRGGVCTYMCACARRCVDVGVGVV